MFLSCTCPQWDGGSLDFEVWLKRDGRSFSDFVLWFGGRVVSTCKGLGLCHSGRVTSSSGELFCFHHCRSLSFWILTCCFVSRRIWCCCCGSRLWGSDLVFGCSSFGVSVAVFSAGMVGR
ncbi:hypothetical protein TSUD_226110 [Trifolium subterraneum]|uniref:Uncharacterized protein n=1 Tax=Trifolium subterraneum TaxID=3900 RepID=A0A2Z6M4Q3_TRISU|nr:hypothetical protein TSUD_226110 [Trifolium subterraneum]